MALQIRSIYFQKCLIIWEKKDEREKKLLPYDRPTQLPGSGHLQATSRQSLKEGLPPPPGVTRDVPSPIPRCMSDTRQHGRAPGGPGARSCGLADGTAAPWVTSCLMPPHSAAHAPQPEAAPGARSRDRCGSEASLVLQLTRLQPEGMPAGSMATPPQTRAAQGQCPGRIRGHLGSLSSACRRHSPHGPDLLKPRGKHTGSHAHTLTCR